MAPFSTQEPGVSGPLSKNARNSLIYSDKIENQEYFTVKFLKGPDSLMENKTKNFWNIFVTGPLALIFIEGEL